MTISDKIRVLCARKNISMAELARLTGQSTPNLNLKLKRASFNINDLDKIASVVGANFEFCFIVNGNERI